MIRNIIFDWSGTLVDDLPAVWHASNHVFRQAGVAELTLDQFRAEFALPFKKFYDRYTPGLAMDQLEAWFHGRFKEVQHTVVELPFAREFLEFCRARGVRTFLLSTIHPDHFAEQTSRNGFDGFLDRPYTGVWDKMKKIGELLVENGLRADETVFIGDMQHDIETARHGGVFSCAVLTGYNRLDQLRASSPDLIVEHLGELKSLLEQGAMTLAAGGSPRTSGIRPVPTVGALIFDGNGRVLMIRTQKWSGLWGIPGGKIEYGEEAEAALRREVSEETGLKIDGIEFVMVQDCAGSKEFYREAHFILLNYTCQVVGETAVRLNEEAQEFRWVTMGEAQQMDLNTPTRRLLSEVESRSGQDEIAIEDLEVFYRVGVPDAERAQPQRLLLCVRMAHDFKAAARSDDLRHTIDYFAVSRRLLTLGEGRSWRLIETLASDVAGLVLSDFGVARVTVEVKKFIIPEARHVSVKVTRERA